MAISSVSNNKQKTFNNCYFFYYCLQVKCCKYWPETTTKYGTINVTLHHKQLFPYYVVHTFRVAKVRNS